MALDIGALVLSHPWRWAVLKAVRSLGLPDWAVGAGFVRNTVWDHLHDYAEPAPLADVDVLYFDPVDISREREAALEAQLRAALPDVPWSVRNQARMHLRNGDDPYKDTEDALRYWLETATCVAVRLQDDGGVAVIAPYGTEDLLGLRSGPTPRGMERYPAYLERMRTKNWPERWPKVRVAGL